MLNNIRMRIYNEALSRLSVIPNVIIETERGNFRIHDYIQTIIEDGNFGGDFELSKAYDIFNINIIQYLSLKKIIDYYRDNQTTGDNLSDIYYYIYHYNKSNNKEGKYSENFLKAIKNSNDIRKKRNYLKKE